MPPIYVPSRGTGDWQALLAEPDRQWKPGYSACELATCWEQSRGFPAEVAGVLGAAFPAVRPLLVLPELKVDLPGGSRASQNDAWVLARSGEVLISVAVEGKVDEPFDRPVAEWLQGASPGKTERWTYLKQILGLTGEPDGRLMYQLFHRTASAVIQAQEFNAQHAVVLVHSFSQTNAWFEEYAAFVRQFGSEAAIGRLCEGPRLGPIQLWFGWCKGKNSLHTTPG